MSSCRTAVAGRAVLLAVAVLSLAFLSEPLSGPADAVAPAADAISIDMDPADNTATSLGARQLCARIDQNGVQDQDEDAIDAVDLDLTVRNVPTYVDNPPLGDVQGTEDEGGITGFGVVLQYDEANLTVDSHDGAYIITANPGSSLFDVSNPVPDSDGNDLFAATIFDLSPDSTSVESGSGVLSRLRIRADASAAGGLYLLVLDPTESAHVDAASVPFDPDLLENAAIAIDEPCDPDLDGDGVNDATEPSICQFDPDCDDDLVSDGPIDPDGAGPIVGGPDNCLQMANFDQFDTDSDGEGDSCDADIDGDGTANDIDPDADGNGVMNVDEGACGSDPLHGGKRPERLDLPGDDDGDTVVDEALPAGSESFDCDGDGFSGADEAHIFSSTGGLDQDPCGLDAWADDVDGGSPPDSANKVNIRDLQTYILPVRRFGTSVGDGNFDVRWDLAPGPGILGTDINIADLQRMVFTFAPMFGGATRAFNGPVCPWTP